MGSEYDILSHAQKRETRGTQEQPRSLYRLFLRPISSLLSFADHFLFLFDGPKRDLPHSLHIAHNLANFRSRLFNSSGLESLGGAYVRARPTNLETGRSNLQITIQRRAPIGEHPKTKTSRRFPRDNFLQGLSQVEYLNRISTSEYN